MREIKFKLIGRNKKFNEIEISQPTTLVDLLQGNYSSFFSLNNREESGNCEYIGEILYTGIKDKNGKEIYEGDIIKYDGEFSGKGIGEVTWHNGGWYVGYIDDMSKNISSLDSLSYKEIIGNIYQNKELLK